MFDTAILYFARILTAGVIYKLYHGYVYYRDFQIKFKKTEDSKTEDSQCNDSNQGNKLLNKSISIKKYKTKKQQTSPIENMKKRHPFQLNLQEANKAIFNQGRIAYLNPQNIKMFSGTKLIESIDRLKIDLEWNSNFKGLEEAFKNETDELDIIEYIEKSRNFEDLREFYAPFTEKSTNSDYTEKSIKSEYTDKPTKAKYTDKTTKPEYTEFNSDLESMDEKITDLAKEANELDLFSQKYLNTLHQSQDYSMPSGLTTRFMPIYNSKNASSVLLDCSFRNSSLNYSFFEDDYLHLENIESSGYNSNFNFTDKEENYLKFETEFDNAILLSQDINNEIDEMLETIEILR